MTDKQAKRIEKLLKLHAYQLDGIYREIVNLAVFIAPDDMLNRPGFKEQVVEKARKMQNAVTEFIDKLNTEAAEDGSESATEANEPEDAFGKFKN